MGSWDAVCFTEVFDADENRETWNDFEHGVIVGLLIGEGSFSGDGKQPSCAISMHVRHEELLKWVRDRVPGSHLYGPYSHDGRHYFRWMCRGDSLVSLLAEVEDEIRALCPHVASRIDLIRGRYALVYSTR